MNHDWIPPHLHLAFFEDFFFVAEENRGKKTYLLCILHVKKKDTI